MVLMKNTPKDAGDLPGGQKPDVSDHLSEMARKQADAVLKELESQSSGLSAAEVDARIKRYG